MGIIQDLADKAEWDQRQYDGWNTCSKCDVKFWVGFDCDIVMEACPKCVEEATK